MGSSTEHSAYGPTHNPWDLDRIPGGSGGGSRRRGRRLRGAAGDRHRHRRLDPPARRRHRHRRREADVRRGVAATASSRWPTRLDQAGPVTRTVLDAALLHEVIGGHDPLDSTSDRPAAARPRRGGPARAPTGDLTGVRIGVVTELGGEGYQAGVLARFQESVDLLVKAGAEVVEVSCPQLRARARGVLPDPAGRGVQQPRQVRRDALRPAGAARGRRDPSAEDVMRATRDAGFGDEVKRRIILGTYALSSGYYDAYYGQAQKVRTLISRDFDAAFEQADVLVSPDRADHGVQARREARRPAGDVPQRPRHHPGQPRRRARHLGAQRPRRRGRPAGRRPDPGAGAGRRPALPRRRRARGRCSPTQWGGPLLDQAPGPGRSRDRRGDAT